MIPKFLQPEVIPYASVTIVRAICAWCVSFDPTDRRNQGATHVICAPCYARLAAELQARDGRIA